MSLKTEVQALLNKLNQTEAKQSEQWQEAYDLALNAKIQADRIVASYGADDLKNKIEPKLKQLWNYKLPNEIAKSYWWEANTFADWMSEYIPFNAIAEEDILEIELFKRYAFLWGTAVWLKKEKRAAYFGGYSKNGKNVKVSLNSVSYDNIKDLEKNKLDYVEFAKEDVVVLSLWWDSIGFWVKAIPYLGTFIYYKRNWQKTMSFAQIIPVVGVSSELQKNQISNFLTDPDNFEWNPPKDPSNKLLQGDFIGEKMRWLVPDGIRDMFYCQMLTVDKHWELLCNNFGRIVENAAGEQRLAADANTFSSNSEYIFLGFIKKIKAIAKEMSDVAKLDEQEVEEQLDKVSGESDGNSNARKEDGDTSEKSESAGETML